MVETRCLLASRGVAYQGAMHTLRRIGSEHIGACCTVAAKHVADLSAGATGLVQAWISFLSAS